MHLTRTSANHRQAKRQTISIVVIRSLTDVQKHMCVVLFIRDVRFGGMGSSTKLATAVKPRHGGGVHDLRGSVQTGANFTAER